MIKLLRKIVSKAKSMLFVHKRINIYDLRGSSVDQVKPAIDAEFVALTRGDIEEIASFLGVEPDSDKYQSLSKHFDNNAVGYGARYKGTMIAIGWGVRHEDIDPSDGFSLIPSDDQIIISDLYTHPDFRGKGILPFILSRQLEQFCKDGYHCLIAIDSDNHPSIRVAQKLGFELARTVRYVRLLGLRLADPGGTRIGPRNG